MTIGKAEAVVLYPKEQEKIAEPNAGSLVLFWKWEGVRRCLPEIFRRRKRGIAAESACLRDPAGRTSRFSYIHLPGVSGTGTTVVSVISCAMKNRYGHPSPDTVEQLKKRM